MALNLTKSFTYLKKITIYENKSHFYFIGEHNLQHKYFVFTIRKLVLTRDNLKDSINYSLKDLLVEHKKEYTKQEYKRLIADLQGRPATSLVKVDECFGIFGFVKFYLGYYVILVNETLKIGKITKYVINRVDKVKYLPLFYSTEIKQEKIYDLENKYLTIFKGIDFNKQLYFSYTYNMTKTLQRNFVENLKSEILINYNENFYTKESKNRPQGTKAKLDIKKVTNNYFLWNHHHLKEFFNCIENKIWCIYFIYGFFKQIECNIYGLRFLVSVIARRNRYYAGTRYLKRGINNDGNVANDVETEQILEEISTSCADQPIISSFIHIRGSVPIYWHQDQNGILPKPDIKVNLTDFEFEATRRHFYLLSKRYGNPCLVCNLTKAKEGKKRQETLLNEWYKSSIDYINKTDQLGEDEKIVYAHYDLKALRQLQKFYKTYCDESCKLIAKTNMFCFIPHLVDNNTYMLSLQRGVIRSNCVDCLDRTNVYQQVIGTAVMVIQLRILGVEAFEPDNEYEEIYGILTEIYKQMGNELSSQYAGSLAHKQTIKDNRSKVTKLLNKFPEMFNTFKRYFNNSFNDQNKQNAINLFLGKFQIKEDQPNIWEIVNDTDLHKKKDLPKLDHNWSKEGIEYYTTFNLINDIIDKFNSIKNIISKKGLIELGKEFNLDVIERISISKYNKPIPILTSQGYRDFYESPSSVENELLSTDTFDYLIRLDKYLAYKKTHPLKYVDQIMYQKEIPIFSFLDIDPKEQIKTFEKFSYQSQSSAGNAWNMVSLGTEVTRANSSNDNNVAAIYDQTIQKGITSSQMFSGRKMRKRGALVINEENNQGNKEEEHRDYNFNVCSFEIEDDMPARANDFCTFNLMDNKYGRIEDFNSEEFLKFDTFTIDGANKNNIESNEYVDDILSKMNTLDIENKFSKDNQEIDRGYDILLLGGKSYLNRKHKTNNIQISNSILGNLGVNVKIDEEHFPI